MLENPFAVLGALLQWISSLLLVLLFYRLGRIGTHRQMLWIWAAAWGAKLVSLTGFTLNAVAALAGRPFAAIQSLRWLDAYYVPATMLFMTLIGIGVAHAVGRRVPGRVERIAVLTSITIGLLAVLLGHRVLTGALLVTVTTTVFLGALVRIIGSERRLWGRRLLLPVSIVLLGTVTVTFQLMRYVGATLDPLGDFANIVQNLSGYADALACALLGAAVIVMITEDSVRAREYAQQEQIRILAEAEARDAATNTNAAPVPPGDHHLSNARYQAESPRIDEVAVVVEARVRPRATIDDSAPLRAPPLSSRTATLPQPVRQPDGRASMALLIDDEAPVRSTLARIFQRGGWAVREAATGAEALSWLLGVDAREAPAVVLCDLMMPGLGGRELYAHLQDQRPEFLQRLIFASDGVDEASTAAFIHATGCQLIHKPGSVEEVARAVEQVVRQQ